jgi:high-affinity iron transporter
MPLRAAAGMWLIAAFAGPAHAQDPAVQRIAGMVAIAVVEYGNGIDARGHMISAGEYKEAVDFLAEARAAAARLPSQRQPAVVLLDSIIQAAEKQRPPADLAALEKRFRQTLGSDAATAFPRGPLNPDSGRRIYAANCASCHGVRGAGDGPLATSLNPRPPALADPDVMRAVTPEIMYRKIEIGVNGTAMPAFSGKLSAADRWNVVAYLTELRHAPDVTLGEGLYVQNCASCHGATGAADGPLTSSLSKVPPDLASFAWQAQRSDSQVASAIHDGVRGSPMPPIRGLSAGDEREIVAYLRSLAIRDGHAVAAQDTGPIEEPPRAAARSLGLLEQSLSAARAGRTDDAAARATDAYMSFEPVETRSRPKNPGLILTMELTYQAFKDAVKNSDVRRAEEAQAKIEGNMPAVIALTTPTGSGIDAFWQSFLIILREGFEAILVIGAVVAFLLKTGHRERLRSIWWGVILALIASGVTAVVLKTALGSIPASREIIEGATLLISVVVLFSVSYWLISRVEAAKWQQFIKEKVDAALNQGGGRALAFVAFLAVYREGAETALFYQAILNDGSNVVLPIGLGILVGFVALAIIFTLFYRYGVRIPLRPFFGVTSVLLYYMAFVFTGKGIRELQEGNAMSATFITHFPTVDWLGMYPTWETILAQLALLILFTFAVLKTFWPRRSVALPTVQPQLPTATQLDQIQSRIDAIERRIGGVDRG